MSVSQRLSAHPQVLLTGCIITFIILVLSLGHSSGAGSEAVSWVKGTSKNHENSSPLQKKISEIYNSTLGVGIF